MELKQISTKGLLDFVRSLKDKDENDPIIESFAANGIPQVELEDCHQVLEVLIQIYMGTLRTNFIKAVKPKKVNPFKVHKGGLFESRKVVSSNAPVLEVVL